MKTYPSVNIGFVPKPSAPVSSVKKSLTSNESLYDNSYFMSSKNYGNHQPQLTMKPWVPNNSNQQERPVSIISSEYIDMPSNDRFKRTKPKHTNSKHRYSKILKVLLVVTMTILMLGAIAISIYALIQNKITTTTTTTTATTTTSTTSTTTTTTTTTAANLPAQCYSYSSISDATRLVTAAGAMGSDYGVFPGTYTSWYRINGASGTQITTTIPNYSQCGGLYAGWYASAMPAYGNTVIGTVCYVYTTICYYSNTILVTNCGAYYVYALTNTPTYYTRYCTS